MLNEDVMTTAFDHIPQSQRIIVALDCDRPRALELADALSGAASWVKVGMTLFYREGPSIVAELQERGLKSFIDLKLHDIPHQVEGAAKAVALAGADMMTFHGLGGQRMLAAGQEGIEALGLPEQPITLAVTVLTSMGDDDLAQIGVDAPAQQEVMRLAGIAREAGLSGVVASPQEARMLRGLLGPNAAIVTPGVRPAGADAGDQTRIATPQKAFADGASHLVIGRPITEASNPRAAFEAIAASLEG